MSKFFKTSKKQKEPEVRAMEDINKEYSDLIGKLGIEEFKKHVCERNIEQYKFRLIQVNEEANKHTLSEKEEIKND